MESPVLRAGVAGAGVFGGYHARKYDELEGVRLAAVYDHHVAHARALAARFGAAAFDDLDAFLAAVELVTVATPADSHAEIAARALAAGRHAYVEKPLARDREQARALVERAAAGGLVLACGHQERIAAAAMGLFDLPERPSRIQAVRRGTPSERNRDVSCVLDLMIHDLDLAAAMLGDFVSVEAEGGFDEVRARVTFEGAVARFEASRVAQARERTMALEFEDGLVEIDFLAPSFVNETEFALNPDFATTPQGRDPLGTSVAGFVAAVRGEGRPAATGEDGLRALALALAVEKAAGL